MTADSASAAALPDAYECLLGLIQARRSCRRYDPARPVARALLDRCAEAARRAPSACNRQPWRLVIADAPQTVERLRAEARKPGIPHPWWEDVPVFVALCARLDILTHRVAPLFSGLPYYLIDMGIAGEHFVLAAEALGLGTCWIGWFDERGAKRVLGIPRSYRVVSLLTVGWPAADVDDTRSSRLALDEIRQWNRWDGQGDNAGAEAEG
jgi:nitroreductase